MKVWIDQDLCTGDALCEEIAPDVFKLLDDGLAYVVDPKTLGVRGTAKKILGEGGPEALAMVSPDMEDRTIEAADECPGDCIFLEPDEGL